MRKASLCLRTSRECSVPSVLLTSRAVANQFHSDDDDEDMDEDGDDGAFGDEDEDEDMECVVESVSPRYFLSLILPFFYHSSSKVTCLRPMDPNQAPKLMQMVTWAILCWKLST